MPSSVANKLNDFLQQSVSTNYVEGRDFNIIAKVDHAKESLSPEFINSVFSTKNQLSSEKALMTFLSTAAISVSVALTAHNLNCEEVDSILLWLSGGLMDIINDSFNKSYSSEVRKIAYDLSYMIITSELNNTLPACGLTLSSLSDLSLVRVFLKLLISFIVTVPAHFPYMPLKHFESVSWPVFVTHTCSGKVKNILSLTNTKIKQGDVQCKSNQRSNREPWVNMFKLIHFIELERLIYDFECELTNTGLQHCTNDTTDSNSVFTTLSEVKELLHNVFERFASIGSQLLRATTSTTESTTAEHCVSCNMKFTIFSMGFSTSAMVHLDKKHHHCRVCHRNVCSACSISDAWLKTRACLICCESLVRVGILSENKLCVAKNNGRLSTNSIASTVSTSTTMKTDSDDEWDELGRITRCCSELMCDDLREWRDEPLSNQEKLDFPQIIIQETLHENSEKVGW